MELNELLVGLREQAAKIDVSNVDFLAVQINLKDMNPGTFYIEVKDHRVSIEPYEYYDRNCALTLSYNSFMRLMSGDLDPVAAFTVGKLKVDGDVGKALEFSELIKQVK